MTETSKGDSGFLSSVLGTGSLALAWIYVMGWSYLHAYYRFFGININSLDFPVSHYLTFCFTQFASFRWTGILLGLLALVLFLLIWLGTKTNRKAAAVLLGVGILALFWFGFWIAFRDARAAALSDMSLSSPQPIIVIEWKQDQKFINDDIDHPLRSDELRLLLETKEHIYVFKPVDTRREPLQVKVIELSRAEIAGTLRIVRAK